MLTMEWIAQIQDIFFMQVYVNCGFLFEFFGPKFELSHGENNWGDNFEDYCFLFIDVSFCS